MFLTRSPLNLPEQAPWIPFDLHVLSPPPAFVLSQDQTLHQELPTCVGCVLKESSWDVGGKTLTPQFLTFIFVFVRDAWECIPELTWMTSMEIPCRHPHCCSVFSSVFKEQMLSACTKGSDTDTQLCVKRLEGASCNANGVQPNSNMGFREI